MIKIIKGELINNKIKTSKSLSWIKANVKSTITQFDCKPAVPKYLIEINL